MGVDFFGEASYKNTDGCWIISHIARVRSNESIQRFSKTIGKTIGMTQWQPVQTANWDKWQSLTISAEPDFIRGVQSMGHANAKINECLD